MSEYLPQEVLVEIFLKLPTTKAIIQCTSVCKSWYSLITSPSFISAHLNYQNDGHLLVRYMSVDPEDEKNAEWRDCTPVEEIYALYSDNHNFDFYAQFIDVPFKIESNFNIVGCCNGLLCLSDDLYCYNDIFYLWNPSIRKSVQLPRPIFTFSTIGPFDHTLGFGFDPVTNDYKVIRIVHTRASCNRVPPQVELYKLSTDVWQDITHVSPAYRFFRKTPGVYLNGACHWVAKDSRRIVLFDVHDETFHEMMLPRSVVSHFSFCGPGFKLFVSEESLCLADRLFDNDKTCDIWRMKEYGDPKSWVKQYSINSHITFNVGVVDEYCLMFHGGRQHQVAHYLVNPIASRRNGEILWRANNGNLVSYDIAAKNIKNLGIHNANFLPYDDALYVSNYKMSLILLDKRTYYLDGDTCEESSNLCKRELKGGRKILEGNTKRGVQIESPDSNIHVRNETKEA